MGRWQGRGAGGAEGRRARPGGRGLGLAEPGRDGGAAGPAGQRAAAAGLVALEGVAPAVGAAAQRAGGGVVVTRVGGVTVGGATVGGAHGAGRHLVDGELDGGVGAPASTGHRGRRPVPLVTT